MEAKLFLDQDTRDYSKIKKAIAILAAGSIFGLAGCGSDSAENVDIKNSKVQSSISSSEITTSTLSPIESAESAAETPESTPVENEIPPIETYEEPQPALPTDEPIVPQMPTPQVETTYDAPAVQTTQPEQVVSFEILHGTECAALPEDIRLTTYTILDTKNEAKNTAGQPMSGLKDNAEYRIKRSISEHDEDARMVLTEAQESEVEQSVSQIVDEDFGGDIAPDGGSSLYDVTFVGYASDKNSTKYDVKPLNTQVDGLPAYQLTDVSFCVSAITKTR